MPKLKKAELLLRLETQAAEIEALVNTHEDDLALHRRTIRTCETRIEVREASISRLSQHIADLTTEVARLTAHMGVLEYTANSVLAAVEANETEGYRLAYTTAALRAALDASLLPPANPRGITFGLP